MSFTRCIAMLAALSGLILVTGTSPGHALTQVGGASGHATQPAPSAEKRVAEHLARSAVQLLHLGAPGGGSSSQLSVEIMEITSLLLEEALDLVPEDVEMHRLALAVATLAEATALQERAVEALVRLDPRDDVARLKLLTSQLRSINTAEELVEHLEQLIESSKDTAPAVASRLAMDLAFLYRRLANTQQFANWLAHAINLDRSNQSAAAVAAGYFYANVEDPVAEGELLFNLLMANPADVETQVLFAAHLLGHGAYAGAHRLYAMAISGHRPAGMRIAPDLVADRALSQFGRGDAEGALSRINDFQREANIEVQQRLQQQRPDLSSAERASRTAILSPTFATVRAAIHQRLGQDLESALNTAIETYDHAITESEQSTEDDGSLRTAMLQLEKAWVLLWLGGSVDAARTALDKAKSSVELSESAEARFAGWEALREGDRERAIELLEPHAHHDVPAQLGYAIAMIEGGMRRSGAQELLAVARAQPGTLIGVYAAHLLTELLGRHVPLTPEARALDELVANMPRAFDRFAQDPTTALSIRLIPASTTFEPYEPLIVTVEISNNSSMPLAIDAAGPIRPEIALIPSVQIAGRFSGALPPIIVGIDRRLRLMPRERLLVPVDLRRTVIGDAIDASPLTGAIVRIRAVINFRATSGGSIIPDLLGSETSPLSLRVDGVRATPEWMRASIERDAGSSNHVTLSQLALLGHATLRRSLSDVPEEQHELIVAARQHLSDRLLDLDPAEQAWLITTLPQSSHADRILEPVKASDDRLVQLMYMLNRVHRSRDPYFDAIRREDDARLTRLANLIQPMLPESGEDAILQFDILEE